MKQTRGVRGVPLDGQILAAATEEEPFTLAELAKALEYVFSISECLDIVGRLTREKRLVRIEGNPWRWKTTDSRTVERRINAR